MLMLLLAADDDEDEDDDVQTKKTEPKRKKNKKECRKMARMNVSTYILYPHHQHRHYSSSLDYMTREKNIVNRKKKE